MKTWENMTGTAEQAQASLLKENLTSLGENLSISIDSTQIDALLAAKPELAQFIERARKFQEELHDVAQKLEM